MSHRRATFASNNLSIYVYIFMCVFVHVHTYAYKHALVRLYNDWNSFFQWNWGPPPSFTWALERTIFRKLCNFQSARRSIKSIKSVIISESEKLLFSPYSECMHNITRRNDLARDMAGGRNDCVIQNLKQTEVKNRKNEIKNKSS